MSNIIPQSPKPSEKSSILQKIIHFPLTKIVVGSIVCMSISALINTLLLKPVLGLIDLEEYIARAIRFATNSMIILTTYYWFFKSYENREITELSLESALRDSLLGTLIGMSMISFTIFVLFTLGYYQVISTNMNSSLMIYPFLYQGFIGVTEEVLFRGILYRITEEFVGTRFALIISALLFAVLHVTNEGVNILTMIFVAAWGVMLAIIFSLTRRLWFPIFFHTGWNFALIFFGTTVSGMDEFLPYSFFQSKLQGPDLLTGGAFGPENSIITIVLTLIIVVVLYIGISKRGCMIEPFWRDETKLVDAS